MANTIIHAANGVLTATLATIFTVPANRKFIIKALTIANDSGGAVNLVVSLTFTSGGVARTMIPTKSIADREVYVCPEVLNQVLDAAGVVQASGLALIFGLSGLTIPSS